MHWKDLRSEDEHWLGLELMVEKRLTPPSWRVEFASPWYLRISCEGAPLFWARLGAYGSGFWWLNAPAEIPSALEPLRARDVDAFVEPPGSEAWSAAWARHFAHALAQSPRSPLHEGRWWLLNGFAQMTPADPRPPHISPWAVAHDVRRYASQALASHVCWGFHPTHPLLGLKPPAALSPSRLKVWRKRARDGTLPPVLALFVSPLDGPVVLDGHHRWMAALEEEVPIPLLMLWPADVRTYSPRVDNREVVERLYLQQHSGSPEPKPISVNKLNALAIDAWGGQLSATPRTRAWPIPGRFPQWDSEVRARLDALGNRIEPEAREHLLRAPKT